MKEKIRISVIYKPSYNFFQPNHFDRTTYDFFFTALQRNSLIDVTYFSAENSFDVSKLKGNTDIILLPNNYSSAVPENLEGIRNSSIPVFARTGDAHSAKKLGQIDFDEKWKIDCYFGKDPSSYFYKYYPKHFRYEVIIFGLESSLYKNLKPFDQRIKNKILNSGNVGKTSIISRTANAILNPKRSAWYFYKLRTKCNYLSYVEHTKIKGNKYPTLDYPQYLSQYRASIAATTFYPTQKFWEVPAAGCLTFMEITEKNDATFLGFIDNETAVFINEKNYKKKFEEFLSSPDDPKWSQIANNGRDYVLNNLTNDIAVEKLFNLFKEYI